MARNTPQPVRREALSVIIPTLNEADNIRPLVERLTAALKPYTYEILFVDDNSTDDTVKAVKAAQKKYRQIRLERKRGPQGKAYSLLQGFAKAKYQTLAMIDADLQYPPEALSLMFDKILADEADIVVANRKVDHTNPFRKLLHRGFRSIFAKLIWKFDVDVQSGLKVFRREVIERATLDPKTGWMFDLEFLAYARSGGYRITSCDIDFQKRLNGRTKINWLTACRQMGWGTLRMRLMPPHFVPFHRSHTQQGSGFHYRGEKYITHTGLARHRLAVERTTLNQRLVMIDLLLLIGLGFLVDWFLTLVILVSFVTTMYFLDLMFNLYLILQSLFHNAEIRVSDEEIAMRNDWPRYTVFCPLYRESQVVPQFIAAISALDYPKDKLEVQLLLEEDDKETINDIKTMALPDFFTVLIVPHAMPKTKPKACNYGLLKATGEYAVIYDAEDIPEISQLKKATIAFERAGDKVGCIQAKLNYYNWNQNILTRLFTLEYSLWFDLVLTGLQAVDSPIPLGGTSNHFRLRDLQQLEGWDPFNVTEDADLGMRIAKHGWQTAILDSVTMEEANSEFKNWFKQRSRWIKGYLQTYLVHMRHPSHFTRLSFRHLLIFQLVVGGKVASMLINPLLWIMTLSYFLLPHLTADFIHSLYLAPVFYVGTFSLIFGNFLYMYYYMIGAARRDHPELIPFALLTPLYWLMMSGAAVLALRDFIVRPFHWHKTKHGLHLKHAAKPPSAEMAQEAA